MQLYHIMVTYKLLEKNTIKQEMEKNGKYS